MNLVRTARVGDAQAISALMAQLGYGVSAAALRDRLGRRGDRREVFVAESPDGIVGWVGVSVDETLVEGFGAVLEGLVVEASARSRGIGAQLLQAAEEWARDRGCTEICVRSNVVRRRAHRFYELHGYATVKAQYNFRKRL